MGAREQKRINVKPNSGCEKAGMKSYASLLEKFDEVTKNFKNFFKSKSKKSTKPVLRKVEDDGQKGEVKAEDQLNDSMYLCPVAIGTPPQVCNLHFDTGSSDLWLWSTELDSKTQSTGKSSGHNIYSPKSSSTWKKISGSSWKIRYGDGSNASGIVGTDNVTLGGLCVENQAIELASKLSPQFIKGAGDGLLGLAFGKINTVKPKAVKTPVESMIDQDDIEEGEELFTCYLGSWRDKDEEDQGESFFTFGYIDEDVVKRCGTEMHYVPIDSSKGFWQFKSESAIVNGRIIDRTGNTAIADTGTTLALVFPVDTPAEALPKVTVAVGDKQFEIQKEDFGFAKCGNGMQYGGIQSRGDSTFDILGDTWLKAVYVVFDQGKKRLGVVQRVEEEQNVSAPK
ncbi:eukaryotic aspartyl protease [Paraphaeosphaeria sporulosa]|uniref:Eukaryotic aspartyl protease n=1 Tax=Paraphaeosphaeria sporulosa TaxID=1460663 RepID=A0A177CHX4_9PLEO|nr:eukaryotic aspartyl protease [Paraphaeosphaeria sporulosa]OAG06420.1 eukaryotic aspartyl protease [Paraphaeosphaeria sporulosa]